MAGEGKSELETLKSAGFTPDELSSHETRKRRLLGDAGFSGEEIDAHFGIKPMNDNRLRDFWEKANAEFEAQNLVAAEANVDRAVSGKDLAAAGTAALKEVKAVGRVVSGSLDADPETPSALDLLEIGFQSSVTGLFAREQLPDKFLPENASTVERVLSQVGTLAGDFPFMVVGALAGGATALTLGQAGPQVAIPEELVTVPALAAAGAFALPAGLRESLILAYENGEIDSFAEFWDRTMVVGAELIKGGLTGFGVGKAGELVKPGLNRLAAEVGTMVTLGSALEGEVPEPQDFLDAAILLAGLKASTKTAARLRRIYAETGRRPQDIAEQIAADPSLLPEIIGVDKEVPQRFDGLIELRDPAAEAQTRIEQALAIENTKGAKVEPVKASETAEQEILGRISVGRKDTGRPINFDSLYKDFVDDLHPLNVVTKALREGKDLPTEQDPYKLARLNRGVNGKAEHFLEFGTFEFGTLKNIGKPLKIILEPIKDDLEGLRAYATSRRALELEGRNIETGVPMTAARQVVKSGNKKFKKVFQELQEFQDSTLAYLRDSGLISEEMFAAMKEANRDYVPFFRVMDGKPIGSFVGKGLKTRQPVKRIKGSEREIVDPLESIIKNTYLYISLAERNAIGQTLVRLAEQSEFGDLVVRKVKGKKRGFDVAEDVQRVLKPIEQELGIKLAPEELTIFRPETLAPKENEIVVYRNGKRELFEVDPEIAATFKALDVETGGLVQRIAAIPANTLRAGAILTPEFASRNIIRDNISAFIFSKNGFRILVDFGRGFASVVKKDAFYQEWVKNGGLNAEMVSIQRTYLQHNLENLTRTTGLGRRTWNLAKTPLEILRIMSAISENSTRVGGFRRGLARGRSPAEATFDSREASLDFARMGAKTRGINAIIPFFAVSIQGSDKLIRSFIERPKQTSVRVAASIVVPSVLLYLMGTRWGDEIDREVYSEVPQWQKDLNWIIITGTGPKEDRIVWKIPKPHEQGVVFGTGMERVTQAILDDDPEAFDGFFDAISRGAAPGMIPTFAAPAIETYSNRSLFTGRPIIPQGMEGILPEYQFQTYTTEAAKALGKLIGTLPGLKESQAASPINIENWIRGWSGGLGIHVLNIADKALREAGVLPDPVKPARSLADIPVIKAFIVRHPSSGAQPVQDFFDSYFEQQRVINTLKELAVRGDAENFEREFNLRDGRFFKLDNTRAALSNMRKFVQQISRNPNMGAEEKRQLIDTAYFQMIEVARSGNELIKETEKILAEQK